MSLVALQRLAFFWLTAIPFSWCLLVMAVMAVDEIHGRGPGDVGCSIHGGGVELGGVLVLVLLVLVEAVLEGGSEID